MFIHKARAAGALAVVMLCLVACSGNAPRKTVQPKAQVTTPTAQVKAAAAPAGAVSGLVVRDARAPKDKKFSIHSLWITNCGYGVYTVGDGTGITAPIESLRGDATPLLDDGKPHELRVDHYAVYYNPARKLKSAVGGALVGGVIGAVVATKMTDLQKGSSCPREKMTDGGWYGPGELVTDNPPLVIETAGMLDGKTFSSRTVYSPTIDTGAKIKAGKNDAEFAAALHRANKDLFAATGLDKAPPATPVADAPKAGPAPVGAAVTPASASDDDEGWINTNPAAAH